MSSFSPSQFRLPAGNFLSISKSGTANEKQFKLLAFGLMLIGQVKRLIWIQTDFARRHPRISQVYTCKDEEYSLKK